MSRGIDGRLQSDASLFLLNPSGLMFGPNAILDVNGSFHASTADVLRFTDGATFSARLNDKSTLTVASPATFGFLSKHPTSMTVEDSDLEVPEGEMLSMVGGNIEIRGGTLMAPSGQVTIDSVASSGDAMWHNAEPSADIDVGNFDRRMRRSTLSIKATGNFAVAYSVIRARSFNPHPDAELGRTNCQRHHDGGLRRYGGDCRGGIRIDCWASFKRYGKRHFQFSFCLWKRGWYSAACQTRSA
jgi:hypothetical protein